MNKKLILAFLILAIFGAVSAKAQSDLIGKYYYDTKIDEGRNDFRLLFELKAKNTAVYSNEQNGEETQQRTGIWKYDKKSKQITVIIPPLKNGYQGQNVKLTFIFKVIGNKLKLIKDLPYNQWKGAIYEKF